VNDAGDIVRQKHPERLVYVVAVSVRLQMWPPKSRFTAEKTDLTLFLRRVGRGEQETLGITPVFWKDDQLAANERPAILPMMAQ